MFQCCYADKISALVTCYILDQNQNPRLSAKTRTPQSSSPLIQMLFVSRENLLSSSSRKQSVGGESNTNILFIGGELFRVQSGGTIFVEIHKSSMCLQLTSGNHYLRLEALAARREARASVWLTRWTTHRPLDGICDKAILPLGL